MLDYHRFNIYLVWTPSLLNVSPDERHCYNGFTKHTRIHIPFAFLSRCRTLRLTTLDNHKDGGQLVSTTRIPSLILLVDTLLLASCSSNLLHLTFDCNEAILRPVPVLHADF